MTRRDLLKLIAVIPGLGFIGKTEHVDILHWTSGTKVYLSSWQYFVNRQVSDYHWVCEMRYATLICVAPRGGPFQQVIGAYKHGNGVCLKLGPLAEDLRTKDPAEVAAVCKEARRQMIECKWVP